MEEPLTADDAEIAEQRANAARERAGDAAASAARSLAETARLQDEVARIEDHTIAQVASRSEQLKSSARRHRQDAVEDRAVAERKRREALDNLPPYTDQ